MTAVQCLRCGGVTGPDHECLRGEATSHVHTPELRLRRDYSPSMLLPADAWVCAECEAFLAWESHTDKRSER